MKQMPDILKNSVEQNKMRKTGSLLSRIMTHLLKEVRADITTKSLDDIAYELILASDAKPAFLNYNGFPATICTSINNEIVHGIPSTLRSLRNGDILSIDIGICFDGYFSDMAVTVPIGSSCELDKKLIETTHLALLAGIKQCVVGNYLGDVGHAVDSIAKKASFSVVREYVGHGIGKNLHEKPEILNYGFPKTGLKIQDGMVLAIEPMINIGNWRTRVLEDNWTVVTLDGTKSAHFEHTILITKDGPEILTSL